VLERLVLAVLGAVPASAAGGARRLTRGSAALSRLASVVARPVLGKPVEVRSGPARRIRIRAELRSLAWLTGKVEPEVQAALTRLLRPGDVFVDVGASIGFHSLLAARLVGPGGRVVAFEPSPSDAASLRENAALNALDWVVVVEQAAWRAAGKAYLDRPGEATARVVDRPLASSLPTVTTTLDAYFDAQLAPPPSVVKIDVEGAEAAVLEGMTATLTTVRPAVIVESHGDPAFFATLAEHGYEPVGLERWASVERPVRDAHFLAIPRDG
jgi:FkbM family methyltransferase